MRQPMRKDTTNDPSNDPTVSEWKNRRTITTTVYHRRIGMRRNDPDGRNAHHGHDGNHPYRIRR